MDPSHNKVASKCLSDDANQINMKNVRVNAQVRAVLSLLEVSMNVVGVISVLFNKGRTLFTLTIGIIVFDILLPHAFLMNTSENKNRIVEFGWKNVFKNILGISNNSVGNSDNTATVNIGSGDSETDKEQKEKKRTRSKQPGNGKSPGCNKSFPVNNTKDSAISNVTLNGKYSAKTDTDIDQPNFATLNVIDLEQ
jgi:hypothetical protein